MSGALQAAYQNLRSFVIVGSQSYTTAGTYSWVAPSGVTSVSIVAIGSGGGGGYYGGGGGGGLGYKNNQAVTPGVSYPVVVGAKGTGTSSSLLGTAGNNSYFCTISVVKGGGAVISGSFSNGGSYTGTGGGFGGDTGGGRFGGGGAGGYSGTGGTTIFCFGATGNGAGGGGGSGGYIGAGACYGGGGGGGGVGLLGQGSNGAKGAGTNGGCGGSGGTGGGPGSQTCYFGGVGGAYGGGGGGGGYTCGITRGFGLCGSVGAVRIVWPGNTRTFPSTCVGSP